MQCFVVAAFRLVASLSRPLVPTDIQLPVPLGGSEGQASPQRAKQIFVALLLPLTSRNSAGTPQLRPVLVVL